MFSFALIHYYEASGLVVYHGANVRPKLSMEESDIFKIKDDDYEVSNNLNQDRQPFAQDITSTRLASASPLLFIFNLRVFLVLVSTR